MTPKNNEKTALDNLSKGAWILPAGAADCGKVLNGVAVPAKYDDPSSPLSKEAREDALNNLEAFIVDAATAVSTATGSRRLVTDGPLGAEISGPDSAERLVRTLGYNYPLRVLGDWLRLVEPERGEACFDGQVFPLTYLFGVGPHGYGLPDDLSEVPAGFPNVVTLGASVAGLCRNLTTHIGALPFYDHGRARQVGPVNVTTTYSSGKSGIVAEYLDPTTLLPDAFLVPSANDVRLVLVGYGFIGRDPFDRSVKCDKGTGVLSVVSFGAEGELLGTTYAVLPYPLVGGKTPAGLATTVRTSAEALAATLAGLESDGTPTPGATQRKVVVYAMGDLLSPSIGEARLWGTPFAGYPRGILQAVPSPYEFGTSDKVRRDLADIVAIQVTSKGSSFEWKPTGPTTSEQEAPGLPVGEPEAEGATGGPSTDETSSGATEGAGKDESGPAVVAQPANKPKVKVSAKLPAPFKVFGYENELKILEAALDPMADPMNVLLVGHTGVGKTTIVEFLAHKVGAKFHRLNLNGQTGVDEFVGRWILKDGETVWIDGVLPRAMKEPGPVFLLLDEVNAALPEINFVLQSVLDHARTLVLSEKDGSKIVAGDGFRIIASMNPPEEYIGTKDLNFAFRSRFGCVVEFGYPSPKVEARIVKDRAQFDDLGAISAMVDFATEARKAKAAGKVLSPIGPRDLINWATMTKRLGGDLVRAASVTVLAVPAEDRGVFVEILSKVRTELVNVESALSSTGKSVGSLVAELAQMAEGMEKAKAEAESKMKAELVDLSLQVEDLATLRDRLKGEVEEMTRNRDAFAESVKGDLLKTILDDAATKLSSGLKDALSRVGAKAANGVVEEPSEA